MEGWISIYRQIQDNWIWKSKEPFDKRSAWIDLLLMVNHDKQKVEFDNGFIEVERGQKITSLKQLADRWKWSRHKVSDFLNLLEQDQMLVQVRDTKKTLVSIANYEKYQFKKESTDMSEDIKRNSQGTVRDTNNNDNNVNNIFYFNLLNRYKERAKNSFTFQEKRKVISEAQNDEDYKQLNSEEQNKLFFELMA